MDTLNRQLILEAIAAEEREFERIADRIYAVLRPLYLKHGEQAIRDWRVLVRDIQQGFADDTLSCDDAVDQLLRFIEALESAHPDLKLQNGLS